MSNPGTPASGDAKSCDVLVIGSGPGGYVAAIRAAQLGLKTVCVERENLGGICLNWGCIPTKALLRSAEVLETCHRASEFGIIAKDVSFDFAAIVERSRGITKKISKGVDFLFRKNHVTHVKGNAKLVSANQVTITRDNETETWQAKNIILATGARAKSLPGLELDGEQIIAYREAMTLPKLPGSLIVVGAGAIGVEFASFYRSLGTEVTIVEFLPRLVPNEDADISAELTRAFGKRGIKSHVSHKVVSAQKSSSGVEVMIAPAQGGPSSLLRADKMLIAAGIIGNTEGLGLENLGIKVERGFIQSNAQFQTSVPNIYVIGDVAGRVALAHVASTEGVYVAETIAGKHPHAVPFDSIPACTYCHPEIASVGLTEEKAKAAGIEVKVGKFPFGPLGKTIAAGEYPGLVKFLWDAKNGALVGCHMIGPAVTDLIATPTLGKTTEVNAESFMHTIFAHPTFSEAMKEAAEDAFGRAIHI